WVFTANRFFNYLRSSTITITSDISLLWITLILNYRLFYGLFSVVANCLLDCSLSTVAITSDNGLFRCLLVLNYSLLWFSATICWIVLRLPCTLDLLMFCLGACCF